MDRVSPSEGEGWWFEPTRARQFLDARQLPADDSYMRRALRLARMAGRRGEVPVGALIVCNGQIVSAGWNERQRGNDILGHAEIVALRRASAVLGDWRLDRCTLYATLEPCPMCVGAMLSARVGRLVYGAADPRAGAAGSVVNLADYPGLPHHLAVVGQVREDECSRVLKDFFTSRRTKSVLVGDATSPPEATED